MLIVGVVGSSGATGATGPSGVDDTTAPAPGKCQGIVSRGLAIVPLCHGPGAPLRRNEGAPFENMYS